MPPKQKQPTEHKVLPIFVTDVDEAQGIIEAVVNVFGIIDLGDDRTWNGSYTKTLNERGNQVRVKVLDNHNTSTIMAVIGKPLEIREIGRDELARIAPDVLRQHPDATGGLFTRTQFQLGTPEGAGAFKRLAEGYVNEWSIALDALVVDFETIVIDGKKRTIRNIRQIRLWEYSPVVFGMNQATVTTDVKTQQPTGEHAKDASLDVRLEAYLRMEFAVLVNGWLSQGTITLEDLDALDDALRQMMLALRGALPATIAVLPVSYYGHNLSVVEEKQATLGAKLEARLRWEYNWCVTYWLGDGLIDSATADALDDALKVALVALRGALPEALAAMPMRDESIYYFAAAGVAETKAGRVLSASNRTKIVSARDALQEVLDADQPESDDADEDIDEKALGEPQGLPVTGPGTTDGSQAAEPSITQQAEPAYAASIERELADLNVLIEIAAGGSPGG